MVEHAANCEVAEKLSDNCSCGDGVLALMANDAFEVMNWARRQGLKRDEQVAQVVEAFKKTLSDTKAKLVLE